MAARKQNGFLFPVLITLALSLCSVSANADSYTIPLNGMFNVKIELNDQWNGRVWTEDNQGQNKRDVYTGQIIALNEPISPKPLAKEPWMSFIKRNSNDKFYFVTQEPSEHPALRNTNAKVVFHAVFSNGKEYSFELKDVLLSDSQKGHPVFTTRRLPFENDSFLVVNYGLRVGGQLNSVTELIRESNKERTFLKIESRDWDSSNVSVSKDGTVKSPDNKIITQLPSRAPKSNVTSLDSARKTANVSTPPPPTATTTQAEAAPVFSIKDPKVRAELKTLNARLKTHVIGQDEAVDLAFTLIQNKAVIPDNKPIVLLALGTTGTGKTELGKAIALERYKDINKMFQYDMGSVKTTAQFQSLFGSPKGYVGSTDPGPFEKFLMSNKEGVILFDEIGNMGESGDEKSKGEKEAMLKSFYMMLDEGKWRSPSTGIEYSLENFTILFTSNEGQELTNDLPYDDLRLDEWNRSKDRESLTKLLASHGWPEAFIARFEGNIALFKPLMEAVRIKIAEKVLKAQISALSNEHGIKNFDYDEETVKTLANALFLIQEGGRSIVSGIKQGLKTLITRSLIELYETNANVEDVVFTLEARDHRKNKNLPADQAEVPMTLKAGNAEELTLDLSNRAAIIRDRTRFQTFIISLHEAGHAVANDPKLTGRRLNQITNHGAGNMGGYAQYDDIAKKYPGDRWENAVAHIASMLGGGLAEQIYSPLGGPSSGWTMDVKAAREAAQHYIVVNNLSPHSLEFPTRNGEAIVESELVQKEIRRLLSESEAFARARLVKNWPLLRALTAKLMKERTLSGAHYTKLEEAVRDGKVRAKGLRCSAIFAK